MAPMGSRWPAGTARRRSWRWSRPSTDCPYACIPAGTRNHFALDLGVDRDDVVGALDAFVDGGERRVDLAEINGRVFVNNVSLGLYAEAVQRAGYREAKIRTLLDTVPEMVGPDAEAPHLSWAGPDGASSAVALLVSNNSYRLGRALGSGTRPRIDKGRWEWPSWPRCASDAMAPRPRLCTCGSGRCGRFRSNPTGRWRPGSTERRRCSIRRCASRSVRER